MGWLTGYSYRKSHVINAATGAGANYPIKITVYAGAGTDSVDKVYLNNHGVDASFGDIRFTDDDGSTELSYWMESHVDSDNAVFWVKVTDSLETNPQTIYIYYGKAATSTTSSGINTFIFFEDFNALNNGDLNGQNSWSGDTGADVQTTTVKEGAKACQITGDTQEIDHTVTIENGYKIFVQLYMRSNNTPEASAKYPCNMYIMQGATQISAVAIPDSTNWTPNVEIDHLRNGPAWQKVAGALVNTWYKLKLALLSTTTHAVWIDDVLQTLGTTANSGTVTTGVTKIRIERYNGSAGSLGFFDQIVVGKYVSPEPVHSTWGTEEPYIQEDVTKTYSIDEVIKQLNASKDYSIDVVTKSSGVTKTYSIDEVIKQLSVTKSFDVDTALKEIDVLVQYLTDEVIKQLSASKTYDIDEIIKQINTVKNYSIDEVIKLISSKSYDVDTIMKRMNDSITYNVDLILKRNGIMNSYFIDLLVKKINTAIQYQIDVFLNIPSHASQYDIDLVLMKVQVSNYVVDVMLHGPVEYSSLYLLDFLLGGEFGGLAYYIYSLRERLCLMKSDIRIPIKMPFLLMENSIEWTEDILEKLLDVNSDIFLVNIHNILSEVEGDILYKISIHDWLTVMCSVKPSKKKQIERLKRIETE